MKLLLTSSGIANTSIHNALLDLLGKPIEESSAARHSDREIPLPRRCRPRVGSDLWKEQESFRRIGLEVFGSAELSVLPSIEEEC